MKESAIKAECCHGGVFNIKEIFIDKIYVCLVVCFYILSYLFFDNFLVKVFPLVLGASLYTFFLFYSGFLLYKVLVPFFVSIFCISIMACLYLFFEKGVFGIVSIEFFFFYSLILIFMSMTRLISMGNHLFLGKVFFGFLVFQFILIIGQLLKSITGYGFYLISDVYDKELASNYSTMLSGSFLNANDLSSLTVLMSLFFMLNREVLKKYYYSFMFFSLLVVVLTTSRSSLVVFLVLFWFFEGGRNFHRTFFITFVVLVLLSLLYFLLSELSGKYIMIDRVFQRVNSIFNVLNSGVLSDNSLSLRTTSYIHFLSAIPDLGFGTGLYQNYTEFLKDLGPMYSLFAINPHSFVVEVGYWLGIPGLLFLIFMLMSIFSIRNFIISCIVVLTFLVLSSVSSTVIGNFIFFMVFYACVISNRIPPASSKPHVK